MTGHIWSLLMTIKDYHPWLWTLLMNITYEHHLWTSDLMTYDSSPVSITQDCYPWLSSMTMNITHGRSQYSWLAYITHDYHLCVSPMTVTDPLSLVMTTYHPWPSSHKTITHDHDYHLPLMTMTSYSQLAPMSYPLMSYLSCLSMTMTYDHHDLWLTTHHSWLSHPTIIHDHHSWSSGLFTWLLTHDFSLMAIKVFSPMTMVIIGDFPSYDHHPWAWHTPYDHDFSPMTSHPTTMTTLWPWSVLNDHQDTHPWPSEWSAMSTLGLSCGQLTWTVWGVSMMSTMIDTSTVHGESMSMRVREYERMRVWYPLIKMTEMIEMTKEGQKRFWWYFLNIVFFLVFLCIVVWVWVVSGVFVVCVLVGVGDWYKRSWVGKWVAPAILGD